MILHKPSYYDNFKCIGSKCQDSCCAGWEIEIDEATAEGYREIGGEIGRRLKENITETEEEIYFNLRENKRCPFLNDNNLCDLIIELGEDCLCDICREHPRHYEWFGDYTEIGLGLCCEEAGRLLFESSDKIRIIEVRQNNDSECDDYLENEYIDDDVDFCAEDADDSEKEYIELLLRVRKVAFSLVQNRAMAITNRLELLLKFAEKIQKCIDTDDYETIKKTIDNYSDLQAEKDSLGQKETKINDKQGIDIENTISEMLDIYGALESLDEGWPMRIHRLKSIYKDIDRLKQFHEYYPNAKDYEYEQYAIYLIYRYFMQVLFDGDILGKAKFVCMSIIIVILMDYECYGRTRIADVRFSLEDRINNAKQYAKEIEYCTENMDTLAKLCWEEDSLSAENLIHTLNKIL